MHSTKYGCPGRADQWSAHPIRSKHLASCFPTEQPTEYAAPRRHSAWVPPGQGSDNPSPRHARTASVTRSLAPGRVQCPTHAYPFVSRAPMLAGHARTSALPRLCRHLRSARHAPARSVVYPDTPCSAHPTSRRPRPPQSFVLALFLCRRESSHPASFAGLYSGAVPSRRSRDTSRACCCRRTNAGPTSGNWLRTPGRRANSRRRQRAQWPPLTRHFPSPPANHLAHSKYARHPCRGLVPPTANGATQTRFSALR